VFGGNFSDIGFKATGNVMFRYGVDTTVGPAVGYTAITSCPLAIAGPGAIALPVQNNFVASAQSNLDGNTAAVGPSVSTWDSTVDHGANDCTTGVF
jgi:hypothetical protein